MLHTNSYCQKTKCRDVEFSIKIQINSSSRESLALIDNASENWVVLINIFNCFDWFLALFDWLMEYKGDDVTKIYLAKHSFLATCKASYRNLSTRHVVVQRKFARRSRS